MIDKIDLIISTKNRKNELMFTIEHMVSIGLDENQIYIIDDGSTDGTFSEIVARYPKIWIERNQTSIGYITNRSRLMRTSTRQFILSLDDDSHVMTRKDLEEAIEVLNLNNNYGIFHFNVFHQIDSPIDKKLLNSKVYQVRSYIGCGHLIKKEIIEKLGGYFEELQFYEEEIDYSLRAYKLGYYTVTREDLLVHHRVDPSLRKKQISNVNDKGIYGYFWRIKMQASNQLIITLIHYPFGIGILFFCYRLFRIFIRCVFKEKKIRLFISILKRFITMSKFVFQKMNKLSYKQFFTWIRLPDFPSNI